MHSGNTMHIQKVLLLVQKKKTNPKPKKLHELFEEKIWGFFWFKGKKSLSGKAVVGFVTWKSMSCQ